MMRLARVFCQTSYTFEIDEIEAVINLGTTQRKRLIKIDWHFVLIYQNSYVAISFFPYTRSNMQRPKVIHFLNLLLHALKNGTALN